jgi:hypothetical protein
VRQVIYRHKDFPKNFHPLGDREFLVSAAAKNLEKSLRKRVCPFANHGTLPLHGELSGQVGGQNLAKNQKSVQSEASALKEPTARRCMVGDAEVWKWRNCPKRQEKRCGHVKTSRHIVYGCA